MKIVKKIIGYFFDKDVWIGTAISSIFLSVFLFVGGYIAFVTSINPWYKTVILILLAVCLYILCGMVERAVFKKLGRKSPNS